MTRITTTTMTAGGAEGGGERRLGYRARYIASYTVELCSWEGARPRQHWGLAHSSSPTTRPPRENSNGVGAGSRARVSARSGDWRGRAQTERYSRVQEVGDWKNYNSKVNVNGRGDVDDSSELIDGGLTGGRVVIAGEMVVVTARLIGGAA